MGMGQTPGPKRYPKIAWIYDGNLRGFDPSPNHHMLAKHQMLKVNDFISEIV